MNINIKNHQSSIINHQSLGFTLIELLIVIAIIGVLATLLMVNFVGVRQRARDAQRKSDLRQVQSALEIYRSDNPNGSYPTNSSGTLSVSDIFQCSNGTTSCAGLTKCFGNSPTCSTIYMQKLPTDPSGNGYNNGNYYYQSSNGSTYTLEACLENSGDSQGTSVDASGLGGCASGTYYVLNNP